MANECKNLCRELKNRLLSTQASCLIGQSRFCGVPPRRLASRVKKNPVSLEVVEKEKGVAGLRRMPKPTVPVIPIQKGKNVFSRPEPPQPWVPEPNGRGLALRFIQPMQFVMVDPPSRRFVVISEPLEIFPTTAEILHARPIHWRFFCFLLEIVGLFDLGQVSGPWDNNHFGSWYHSAKRLAVIGCYQPVIFPQITNVGTLIRCNLLVSFGLCI